jgi:hypothetical protein
MWRRDVREAVDELFLVGLIRPCFHCEGRRRA